MQTGGPNLWTLFRFWMQKSKSSLVRHSKNQASLALRGAAAAPSCRTVFDARPLHTRTSAQTSSLADFLLSWEMNDIQHLLWLARQEADCCKIILDDLLGAAPEGTIVMPPALHAYMICGEKPTSCSCYTCKQAALNRCAIFRGNMILCPKFWMYDKRCRLDVTFKVMTDRYQLSI